MQGGGGQNENYQNLGGNHTYVYNIKLYINFLTLLGGPSMQL